MATATQASLAFLVVPGRPPGTLFVTRAGARAGRHFQAPQRLAAALARLAARQSTRVRWGTRVRVRRRDGYRALGGGRWAALGARWSVVGRCMHGGATHLLMLLALSVRVSPPPLDRDALSRSKPSPSSPPLSLSPSPSLALLAPLSPLSPRPASLAPSLPSLRHLSSSSRSNSSSNSLKKKKKPKIREKESVSTLQRRTAAATVNGTPSESR